MLILRKLHCAGREGGSKASFTLCLPQYLLQWEKKKKKKPLFWFYSQRLLHNSVLISVVSGAVNRVGCLTLCPCSPANNQLIHSIPAVDRSERSGLILFLCL